MKRREFIYSSLVGGFVLSDLPKLTAAVFAGTNSHIHVDLRVPCKLFDGKNCWAHPRAAILPGGSEKCLTFVMALLDLSGNDIFSAMYGFNTADGGKTFSTPQKIDALSLSLREIGGQQYYVGMGDIVPQLHAATNKLLATGLTLSYHTNWKPASPLHKRATYAVYDDKKEQWKPWKTLIIPDTLDYKAMGAGCAQRIDRPDGKILLPVSLKKSTGNSGVTVMLCRFDGEELTYESNGNELFIEDQTRGLAEPSLTLHNDLYYLTVRHNERGYVSTSKDGLNFTALRPWTFDDGSDLGNYNTQQHWVRLRNRLYLVYTRRGADNDYVFRNRAPLFMSEVDTDKRCVVRKSEQIILPNNGARYGNFGVCRLSDKESWITDSEWMQPKGCEKYGSDGRVYLASVR